MKNHLCDSGEFKSVYAKGRRYNGSLMTAFVANNDLGEHRLGISVSKKTANRAVDRNRAKRILRESFRLRALLLQSLSRRYDWVLNGKRQLGTSCLHDSIGELESIISRVELDEKSLSTIERK